MGATVNHLRNTTSSDASQKSYDLEYIKKSLQHHAFFSAFFFPITHTHVLVPSLTGSTKQARLLRDACEDFPHSAHTVSAPRPGRRKHRFAVVALNAWSFRDFPRNRAGSWRSTLWRECWWPQSASLFFVSCHGGNNHPQCST